MTVFRRSMERRSLAARTQELYSCSALRAGQESVEEKILYDFCAPGKLRRRVSRLAAASRSMPQAICTARRQRRSCRYKWHTRRRAL